MPLFHRSKQSAVAPPPRRLSNCLANVFFVAYLVGGSDGPQGGRASTEYGGTYADSATAARCRILAHTCHAPYPDTVLHRGGAPMELSGAMAARMAGGSAMFRDNVAVSSWRSWQRTPDRVHFVLRVLCV